MGLFHARAVCNEASLSPEVAGETDRSEPLCPSAPTEERRPMQVQIRGEPIELDERFVSEPPSTVREQVAAYARGDQHTFDLTVAYPESFTGDVMRALAAIPYGETRTYGDVASALSTSAVAVGGACGRNPVPIVVPCHRVVGSDSLGGYSAAGGPALKRRLLAAERGDGAQTDLAAFE
jgi:methylated-DNA-[protein]-cysteine S-methyltransferase